MKRLLSFAVLFVAVAQFAAGVEVSLQGNRILLNGQPVDVYGIRTASALASDRTTEHLIEQLDDYKAHGVNAVTVFYMGSSGGHYDPFTPDGKGWRHPEFRDRMDQIIEAADERGMIVIPGIFYQWKTIPVTDRSLRDWEAAKNAVATVARHLREQGYTNIMLNIANEQNSGGYSDEPWGRVRNVQDILELVRIAKQEHPGLIVGAGGYDHEKNLQLGLADEVDVLMFDTLGPNQQEHSGHWHDHFLSKGVDNKPLINVEVFGGWTGQFIPPGVYTTEGKLEHFKDIADAAKRPGLSVFFHSNTWCQGPSIGERIRYDLRGMGTSYSPGIRWWFERVRDTVEGRPINNPPVVKFVTPSNGAVLRAPADIQVVVQAHDPDGEIASVELRINGDLVGVDKEAPYEFAADRSVRASRRLGRQPQREYELLALARDVQGQIGAESVLITVVKGEAPVASIQTSSNEGASPLTVTFDASASTDADGEVVRYEWDLGDGAKASGPILKHRYESPDAAAYTARLTIHDNDGNIAREKISISIK